MRFPTPPHSIQQMSLLKALTGAAIPVVIVVLHIPAVGIELLTDTLRLQTRIRSTSYCSSTWRVDEVTTQFRGDQKRLQSLGTDKEQRLSSHLSFQLQAVTLEETDGPSL